MKHCEIDIRIETLYDRYTHIDNTQLHLIKRPELLEIKL